MSPIEVPGVRGWERVPKHPSTAKSAETIKAAVHDERRSAKLACPVSGPTISGITAQENGAG
jgi:hypothetical protein